MAKKKTENTFQIDLTLTFAESVDLEDLQERLKAVPNLVAVELMPKWSIIKQKGADNEE